MKKPLKWVLRLFPAMVCTLLAAVLGLAMLGRVERTVEAHGQVTVHNYQVVRTPVPGQVEEVFAGNGKHVNAGQPLLRLQDPSHASRLAEAQQRLTTTRSALHRARAESSLRFQILDPLEQSRRLEDQRQGSWEAELATSRRRESELELEALQRSLEQTRELAEHGLVSDGEVDEAQRRVHAGAERLRQRQIEERQTEALKSSLEIERRLLGGEQQRSKLELAAEMIRLESEEVWWAGEMERLRRSKQQYLIHAEIDGVVASQESNDLIGRQVGPGEELLRVIDVESIRFRSRIPEQSVIQVRAGQTAAVELVGLPKERFKTFQGEVRRIDQHPEVDAEGVPVYGVEILLTEPWVRLEAGAFYLRGGMRGKARIAYRHSMPLVDVIYEFLVGTAAVPDSPTDNVGGSGSGEVARITETDGLETHAPHDEPF